MAQAQRWATLGDVQTPVDDLRARLDALGERHRAAIAELDATREQLRPVVIEALRSGQMTQAEVAARSHYTRETLRNMARAAGIAPAR